MKKNNSVEREDFEREVIEIAATFAQLKKCEGDYRPPHEIVRDLKIIDKALTGVLQKLMPLRLEHQAGQDISTNPFNWPVVQALWDGSDVSGTEAYPTEVIKGLRELRNATRKAIELKKIGRGNSARRNPESARRADLAKNFVFRYRSRFGHMPPMSKSGEIVDLLQKMLIAAGEGGDNSDAAGLLRHAIEKDEAGRALRSNERRPKFEKRVK